MDIPVEVYRPDVNRMMLCTYGMTCLGCQCRMVEQLATDTRVLTQNQIHIRQNGKERWVISAKLPIGVGTTNCDGSICTLYLQVTCV